MRTVYRVRYNGCMQFAYAYVATLIVFAFFDFVWMRVFARNLYRSYVGHLLGPVRWGGVIVFNVVYVFGLTFYAVHPAVTTTAAGYALVLGGLFGLFVYTTYNFANYATLKHWPLPLTSIDIVWGVVVSAVSSWLGFLIVTTLV
jgi:uncharacterized membrane protein